MGRLALLTGCGLVLLAPIVHAADQDDEGRNFPKTLTFDEPGIDDEVSLPTYIFSPDLAGSVREQDIEFELDKRVTPSVSVQINIGYSELSPRAGSRLEGWQNAEATIKTILLSQPAAERLLSLSIIRDFGATGAARIGAPETSATTAALNFGQGFGQFAMPRYVRPFAITGSFGMLVPDAAHAGLGTQVIASASLQYSMDVLFDRMPGGGAAHAAWVRPFIPVVEVTTVQPLTGSPMRSGLAAPGLIYAGDGFQLAAEALFPLTRASGTHIGFVAQLNVALRLLGVAALSRPFFE